MSTSNTVFSVFSFVSFFLVCLPSPWHLRSWNVGTCLYILWTATGTLLYSINSIIWKDDAINRAPVWCDISAKLMGAVSVGIPAAGLCINRRLHKLTTLQVLTSSKVEKRRMIIIDLAIGVGTPVLAMILQYVVQGHRFDIYEEFGCSSGDWVTPLYFVLIIGPPLLLSLISVSYSIRSIITLRRREGTKRGVFATPDLNTSLYFRLLTLASLDILVAIPTCLFYIIYGAPLSSPWVSWKDAHREFSRVGQYPSVVWKTGLGSRVSVELTRWVTVYWALTFFALFGLAKEARRNYKMAWSSIVKFTGTEGSWKWTASLGFNVFGRRFGFKGSRPPSDLPISFRRDEIRGTFDSVPTQGSINVQLAPGPPAAA